MYVCEVCGTQVPAGVSRRRVVVVRREKHYPRREHAMRKPGADREDWKADPGGVGWEIAREASVCEACATQQGT